MELDSFFEREREDARGRKTISLELTGELEQLSAPVPLTVLWSWDVNGGIERAIPPLYIQQ